MEYDKSTFCEIRRVLATVLWLDPKIHVAYWSSDCGHQKVFRLRMLYTKHYLSADLEVYMPNDQS